MNSANPYDLSAHKFANEPFKCNAKIRELISRALTPAFYSFVKRQSLCVPDTWLEEIHHVGEGGGGSINVSCGNVTAAEAVLSALSEYRCRASSVS